MNSKKWIFIYIMFSFLLLFIVGFINYLVDPHWFFTHKNDFNKIQQPFNERQQKINYIYFNGLDNYNSLMLGSSRTSFINQTLFKKMKVFNLAAPDMMPFEYNSYIDIAKKIKGSHFEYIILGLDFFGSNKVLYNRLEKKNKDPWYYYNNIKKDNLYLLKNLLSAESLKKSINNLFLSNSKNLKGKLYTRDLIKINSNISEIKKTKFIDKKINKLKYRKFIYDQNYKHILNNLIKNNPYTKFIVFTTPITEKFYNFKIKEKQFEKQMKDWKNDIKELFPNYVDLFIINNFTKKNNNFIDAHHIDYKKSNYIINELEKYE